MPCNKISYETKHDAKLDAKRIRVNQRHLKRPDSNGKAGGKLRPYHCWKCNKWHLTSMRKFRGKPNRERGQGMLDR